MMTPNEIAALTRLQPVLMNVIGFYELLYELGEEPTPYQRMMLEAQFATNSRRLAVEVMRLIDGILDRERER